MVIVGVVIDVSIVDVIVVVASTVGIVVVDGVVIEGVAVVDDFSVVGVVRVDFVVVSVVVVFVVDGVVVSVVVISVADCVVVVDSVDADVVVVSVVVVSVVGGVVVSVVGGVVVSVVVEAVAAVVVGAVVGGVVAVDSVAAIISDSNRKYLKEVSQQKDVVSIYKGGWTSSNLFSYIHKNLRKLQAVYRRISLYIWVGTCDFTEKVGQYIRLGSKQPEVLERLCSILQGIQDICSASAIKLTSCNVLIILSKDGTFLKVTLAIVIVLN